MMNNNELKYKILNRIAVSEPFFVLVSSVNWRTSKELENFMRVLSELVESGCLTYTAWNQGNTDPRPASECYGQLKAYVSARLNNRENLDEVPLATEYDFELTENGVQWLEEHEEN